MSIVPPSSLQVDIYVTNFKPVPANLPTLPSPSLSSRLHLAATPTIHEELAPPHPNFARNDADHRRSNSSDSVDSHDTSESDVDFGYYKGEQSDDDVIPEDLDLAHETNILELTNFQDEEDIVLPGERGLSLKVKQQGRLRRLQTRQGGKPTGSRRNSESGLTTAHLQSPSDHPPRSFRQSVLSTYSTDRLIPMSPLSERRSVISESDHVVSSVQRYGDTSLSPRPQSGHSTLVDYPAVSLVAPAALPAARGKSSPGLPADTAGKSEARSPRHSTPPQVPRPPNFLGFEIDEQEANDVDVVSEHVRSGKPKLEKLIADEVEQSKGSVVVACESDPVLVNCSNCFG